MPQRDLVFISYSHLDAHWLEKLHIHLKPLVRQGSITTWADTDIRTGARWEESIEKALSEAQVAVLLVTPNYLASDFIASQELPPIFQAAEKEGMMILWVAVSFSSVGATSIADYQSVNDPAHPLDSLDPAALNKELVRIVDKIANASRTKLSIPAGVVDDKPRDVAVGIADTTISPNADRQQKDDPARQLLAGGVVGYLAASAVDRLNKTRDGLLKYDSTKYVYDGMGDYCRAGLLDGAYLYSITPKEYSERNQVVSGVSAAHDTELFGGLFHSPQQYASYCANNVLTLICDVLHSMVTTALKAMARRYPYSEIASHLEAHRYLVVFTVMELGDLVFAPSRGIYHEFGFQLHDEALRCPELFVNDLKLLADRARHASKRGILYPSARHSRGMCLVFFRNESNAVHADPYVRLELELKLVGENSHIGKDIMGKDIIDIRRGYFEFIDPHQMDAIRSAICPLYLTSKGIVELVRRDYWQYPADAVMQSVRPTG
jgi:hypothetical protein